MTEAKTLRLLPPAVAAEQAGISVRTLRRAVRDGSAPAPVKITKQRVGFYEHEVQAWLASLPRTREVA